MIKREEYYKIISDCLGQLEYAIKYRAKQNLLDINVVAEDFVSQVLNKIHDWSLKNLNSYEKNYKAVDIGDVNNDIVIQVTSTRTKNKVQETLKKADEKELYKEFSQIKMFIITHKQDSYKDLVVPKNITFDWKKDIWDWSDVNDSLKDLSDEKLIEISKLVQGSR